MSAIDAPHNGPTITLLNQQIESLEKEIKRLQLIETYAKNVVDNCYDEIMKGETTNPIAVAAICSLKLALEGKPIMS